MPVRSIIQRGRPGALEKASTLAPESGKKGAKVFFEFAATSLRFSISCFSMRDTVSSNGLPRREPVCELDEYPGIQFIGRNHAGKVFSRAFT